jgi:hypothetical protein
MKKFLFFFALLFLFQQGLVLAQPSIDQSKYVYDYYDINAPVSGAPDHDDQFDFDGFMSFQGDGGHLRFDDFKLPNAYGPNLAKVSAQVFSLRINSKRCDLTAYVSITYPVNLGSPQVDDYVKSLFKDIFETAVTGSLQMLDEELYDPNSCQTMTDIIVYQSSFKILSSNANVLSVAIMGNVSAGYNHPQNIGKAINIDIKNLKNINLSDIFPQTEASLKKLWPYLANAYCKLQNSPGTLPMFYGQSACPKGGFGPSSPLPTIWKNKGVNFGALGGNVYLAPEGLYIELGGYDSWSYARGPSKVFVPKDTLIRQMGASPAFW